MRLQAAGTQKQKKLESRERKRRLGLAVSIFLGVVVIHFLAIPVVGVIALVKYFKEPEAVFEIPPKEVRIPPQKPEQKMNVQKHEAMMPKPAFTEKLISTRPIEFALPDLPQVDLDQMLPLDPSELVNDQVSSLMGSSGIGRGLGSELLGGGGSGEGMSFLGIQTSGERIILLFDVSGSVVNKAKTSGIPMSQIKEETIKLIETLPINARFGLIQFVRNYKPFSNELLAATEGNKEAARNWIQEEWRESGSMPSSGKDVIQKDPNGVTSVLEAAYAMDPDVVFLISDGSFWSDPGNRKVPYDDIRKKINELEKRKGDTVPIHFIGFEMEEDERRELERIIRRTRGEFREIGEDG